jgi:hypothetical protein
MIETLHDSGLHVMHHGKCKGIDSEAHLIARRLVPSGMRVVMHPPIKEAWRNDELPWNPSWARELSPRSYNDRDRDIAWAGEVLIGCPLTSPELPSGTAKTMGYARRYRRLVYWIDRLGNIHDVSEKGQP